jgi:hypothetical protein
MFFSAESVNSPKLAHFSYRDVVQSKLDNLGQVYSFSMSLHMERKSLGVKYTSII